MKPLLHKLLAAALLLPAIHHMATAQVTTVTIGDGTATNDIFPITYNFNYSYTQTIYTADELISGGATAEGWVINKIRYKPTVSVLTFPWENWVVYLGNTTKIGFDRSEDWVPASQMTKVFEGVIPASTTANAWMEITLPTPFYWDGSSNLVVAVDQNTNDWGNNPKWAAYTAAPASGMKGAYYRSSAPAEPGPLPDENENADPAAPPAATNRSNTVAQIQFEMTPSPLPVVLTGISARNEGSSNRIEWQSGKEASVSHYEIETSRDGKSFSYLSKTEAMNQPFGYITYDDAPFEGLTYYRLKMIDKDGSFAYSKVVSAFMKGKHGFAMSAFPNPAATTVRVKVAGGVEGAQLQLTDLSGRVIARQEVVGGEAQFDVRSLASGVYFIKYADGQRTEAIKVNKQ